MSRAITADRRTAPTEAELCSLWRDIVGTPSVDEHHRFTDASSLQVMELVVRMAKDLGRRVTFRQVVEARCVAGLARALAAQADDSRRRPPGTIPTWTDRSTPAWSDRRWRAAVQAEAEYLRLREGDAAALAPLYEAFRLSGPLDVTALRAAFGRVVAAHPVLRSRFAVRVHAGAEDLAVYQEVVPGDGFELMVVEPPFTPDAGLLATAASRSVGRPFPLHQAPPLRATLVRVDDHEHLLVITMSHLVGDEASMEILLRELSSEYQAAYQASPLSGTPSPSPSHSPPSHPSPSHSSPSHPSPLRPSHARWASRQRALADGAAGAAALAFWRTVLPAEIESLDTFLTGFTEDTGDEGVHVVRMDIPAADRARLHAEASAANVTLFSFLLAHFVAVVAEETAGSRVSVTTNIANRMDEVSAGVIGMVAQSVVVSLDLSPGIGLTEVIGEVHDVMLGIMDHYAIPFLAASQRIWPARSASSAPRPEARIFFGYREERRAPLHLPGITVESFPVAAPERRGSGVEWLVVEHADGLLLESAWQGRNYPAEYVHHFTERFRASLMGDEQSAPKERR